MQVLIAAGWALLVVFALFVLAIVLPAQVLIDWRGGALTLRVRILFLTFRLYPRRAKKKKIRDGNSLGSAGRQSVSEEPQASSSPPEKNAPPADKPVGDGRKRKRGPTLKRIADSLRAAGGFMRRVLRFVRVKDIDLTLPVHDDDAALTAIRYGRIQASVGSLIAAARNLVRLDFKRVNIFADFDGVCEKQTAFSCKIGAPPVIIAIAAVWAYLRLTEAKVL